MSASAAGEMPAAEPEEGSDLANSGRSERRNIALRNQNNEIGRVGEFHRLVQRCP